jgi:hypothetical protein
MGRDRLAAMCLICNTLAGREPAAAKKRGGDFYLIKFLPNVKFFEREWLVIFTRARAPKKFFTKAICDKVYGFRLTGRAAIRIGS